MKRKNKLIGLILASVMSVSLIGCSNGGSASTASNKSDYPKKQIELIVPFAAGGGTDAVARAFADVAKKHLPEPMGVVNKTGGGGAIGMADGVNAKPDGYKATLVTVEYAILPNLGLASFKTDDLKPVAQLNADPSAVTVRADSKWKTLEEFLDYAKANPEKVRVGNAGSGSIWHLAAAALGEKTGVKFSHIPYDGAAPAVTALLGGHVEAVTVSPAEVSAQVKAGKLRMLGVMADEPLESYKDVPTLKEKNIDLSIGTWRGIAVPKDTPQEVVDTLKEATSKAVEEQAFKDVLAKMNLGLKYQDDSAFAALIKDDSSRFKELIEKLNLKQ
ncbi:tripartite tricarboxylate transporter substrate binding protein [Neobacillus sp. KR4-4]|uniref:tripartite tricarboxylate transporter substrate binding protein n=1 Tax=Neobacillus sp. KR4-4 TaxID=3344872 RepID=UPI0035CB3C26